MSGILDRKSRIIDFSLTPEGYRQMALHDIRFKYATFSDNSSIYHSDENNVFISGSRNLRFEVSHNVKDLVNPEIDLNRGGFYNLDLKSEGNSSYFANELFDLTDDSQTILDVSSILHKRIEDNLKEKNILLTTSSLDIENTKIYTTSGQNEEEYFYFRQRTYDFESPPTLLKEDVLTSEFELIKDDARFSNKTNFMYLPPQNEDGSQLGSYINTQSKPSKILVKNSVNNLDNIENAINNSIELIDNNNRIQKKYFSFTHKKSDPSYIFQIYSVVEDQNLIEKLSLIDHGDIEYIDRRGKRKFRRVFSAGKIFRIEKNEIEPGYLQSDQQLKIKSYFGFSNIFTIVFEE
jgi:hypothetical protein